MFSPLGRVVFRTQAIRVAQPLAIRQFTSASRCLATSAVPAAKRATTKATATTKTKAAASKSASTTTKKAAAETKKPTAKKAATKVTEKKTATKKPAAEETAAKKPKAPKKVELTEDQERLKLIKELKLKALDPPSLRSGSSKWLVFLQDKYAPYKGSGKGLIQILDENKVAWKTEFENLTPAQEQDLQARVDKSKSANTAALQNWINRHTPEEIHKANIARARLMRIKASSTPPPYGLKGASFSEIPDERFPKRPRTAHVLFAMDKLATVPTEGKVGALIDCMKEFKNLPEAEIKKYHEAAAKDKARYIKELIAIGLEPSEALTGVSKKPAVKKTA